MDRILLEESCEILDSRRIPITASNRKEGPYPYYGANGIQDYVDDYIFDDELVLLAEDGGNFGSKERPIAYRVSGKCWVNNHAHVLKPKENIDVDYLCYSLMFYDTEKLVNGATRQKLTQTMMRKMLIQKRTMFEQKKIVTILNTVYNLLENQAKKIEILDNLIKARFVEMFGDRFLNTMNWPTKKLGDCATFRNGKAHEKVISETGQYVLITSRAIASDLQDVRHTDSLLTPLSTGDIVMVMSDIPNGKALAKCLLITENEKYTLNQRICSLSNYGLNPVFFTYLLNRHRFFLLFNDGNGQTNLRKDDILNCPLITPPIELQSQFAAFVAQVDKSKFALSNELAMGNFYIRLIHDCIMHGCIDL